MRERDSISLHTSASKTLIPSIGKAFFFGLSLLVAAGLQAADAPENPKERPGIEVAAEDDVESRLAIAIFNSEEEEEEDEEEDEIIPSLTSLADKLLTLIRVFG